MTLLILILLFFPFFVVIAFLLIHLIFGFPLILGAPYVPTPFEKVERMLRLAEPKPGQTLYDLGSGDGRIIIEAARKYGVNAIGVEINPVLVWLSRRKIRKFGLENKARVYWGNFFRTDFSDADVILLYLWQPTLKTLEKKFLFQLKPGTKICSLSFTLENIPLIKTDSKYPFIRLYKIPIKPETRSPNDEKMTNASMPNS